MNFNGTPRHLFEHCDYTGIDREPGPDVDTVCRAHQYDDYPFDVVITTEMLEHDKYARESVINAFRLLKPGGLLIGTAANVNRPPHYEFTGEDEHYKNISKEMIQSWLPNATISEDEGQFDIYFYAVK